MSTPRVKIAGVALGSTRSVGWTLVRGIAPHTESITLAKARALAIDAAAGAEGKVTLEIQAAGVPDQAYADLYLLEVGPGPDPFHATIKLADQRVWWSRRACAAALNVSRLRSERYFVAGRQEVATPEPEIEYAKYSLEPVTEPAAPWTPRTALEHVLRDVLGVARYTLPEALPEVEIQDQDLLGEGDAALERILAHLPGVDLFPDADGSIVVYDTTDGSERSVALNKRTRPYGGGYVEIVDRRRLRPREVRVHTFAEIEVLWRYTEEGSRTADTAQLVPVLRQPDAELTNASGVTTARGTWLEIEGADGALETWGGSGPFPALDMDTLRKHYLGALRFLEPQYVFGSGAPSSVWGARFGALRQALRRLFRPDELFAQRLAAIKAHRVAVVNHRTGSRAPADVFSDWIRRPSYLGLSKGAAHPDAEHGLWIPWDGEGVTEGDAAPVAVSIVDDQSFVVALDPRVDVHGMTEAVFLGRPAADLLPLQTMGATNGMQDELLGRWDGLPVADDWELGVLLTCVPGSPNDLRRFHVETVTPADAAGVLGADVGDCLGPPVDVIVFPGVVAAQFGWSDERAQDVYDAIRGTGATIADLRDLLVNPTHVRDVALATGASVYQRLLDGPAGTLRVQADPAVRPTGQLGAVRHSMEGGLMVSTLSFPPVRRPVDVWRYLPASTRRALRHTLEQGV